MMCTALYCGIETELGFSLSQSAAIEGTTCDTGKICIKKQCTNSHIANNKTCPFNDQLISQNFISSFKLPNFTMDCDSYLAFYYTKFKVNIGLGCTDSIIKDKCCSACQSCI